MQSLIDSSLLSKLPAGPRDIRDTQLNGFVVRVQKSGRASFYVNPARGRWKFLGRVGTMPLHSARDAAEVILTTIRRETITLQTDDVTITHRKAQARARETVWAARAGSTTLRAFVRDKYGPWLRNHRKSGDEIRKNLENQFAELIDLPLNEISVFAIERWRQRRSKEVKKATVNRNLNDLRGALSRAAEWGNARPIGAVKSYSVDRYSRVRFLEPAEERLLLAALAARDDARRAERESANVWRLERGYDAWPAFGLYTDHLTPLVLLALHTGCRRGELFTLQWGDVDLSRRQIRIRAENAKSGRSRVLPLNARAVEVLVAWRPAELVDPKAIVFAGADGKPLVDVKTAFARILRDASVTAFRFHDLRHTFASKLVQAGVDLNVVRELLGHRDFSSTLRYAHLAPDQGAAAVEKLVSVG